MKYRLITQSILFVPVSNAEMCISMVRIAIYAYYIVLIQHTGEDVFNISFSLFFIKITSPLNPSQKSSLLNSIFCSKTKICMFMLLYHLFSHLEVQTKLFRNLI